MSNLPQRRFGIVSDLPTYTANLCPVFCDGKESYSKPRTAILHNRDGHCKRFLSELGFNPGSPLRRRFSGSHA